MRVSGQVEAAVLIKLALVLRILSKSKYKNLRLALFPTLLPLIYRYIFRLLAAYRNVLPSSISLPWDLKLRVNPRVVSALLSSPLLLLLPPGLRVQLAAFSATSAAAAIISKPSSDPASSQSRRKSRDWRDFLPPPWLVYVSANACLLWICLFEEHAFPQGFGNALLHYSQWYNPDHPDGTKIYGIIRAGDYLVNPFSTLPHKYALCQAMHPHEPSCVANHVKALIYELASATTWLGPLGALTTIAFKRRKLLSDPGLTLAQWAESTLRNSAVVAGSINASWGMTCVLQRLLPPNKFTRSRWLLNGFFGSMWIFLVPSARMFDLAAYIARLAMLSTWKVYKSRGGKSLKSGFPFVIP
ncbi:hypothetical protein BOTBODRAFT_25987 [Botryobasidium botryosum FD-172 SS1]|uniref:Uncharacterized protein n=1 Tax=Botryobasidium botryosum (strain FD-172 SS1) TaxID=930990 RepID=A0A067NCN0_BOTB1|nr:hypothetical protein BOTBODRAFT_25987 [Botryobasidium botryosum FD-172 SS1]